MHLQNLINIVESNHCTEPFPCIHDIVSNGLSGDRFTDSDRKPQRHEITLFLSAWCRSIGLEPEAYQDWLIAFSMEVLSVLSASPLSKIRHSTKSSIKYIHRSEVPFYCQCEKNIFKAPCSSACPVYDAMQESCLQHIAEEQKKIEEFEERQRLQALEHEKQLAALPPAKIKTKEKYKKQFEDAVLLIKKHIDQGDTKKAISAILNEKGFKTSTGRDWTPSSVAGISNARGWSPKRPRKKTPEVKEEEPEQLTLF